jgi:hypothetical protein
MIFIKLKKIPELIFNIFDFLIFDIYNEDINIQCENIFNDVECINRYLFVSKEFNYFFVTRIIQILNMYFNIQIINGKSCEYNFWKNLIYTLVIENIILDDEQYIYKKKHKQKMVAKKRNIIKSYSIKNFSTKMFYIKQRRIFIDEFCEKNLLLSRYFRLYVKLTEGKFLFKKKLNGEFDISSINNSDMNKLIKFEEYYDKYINTQNNNIDSNTQTQDNYDSNNIQIKKRKYIDNKNQYKQKKRKYINDKNQYTDNDNQIKNDNNKQTKKRKYINDEKQYVDNDSERKEIKRISLRKKIIIKEDYNKNVKCYNNYLKYDDDDDGDKKKIFNGDVNIINNLIKKK